MAQPGHPVMPTLRVIDPRHVRRRRWWLSALWLSSLVLAYVVGRYVMIPDAGGLRAALGDAQAVQQEQGRRLAETEQRLANLERAEQIARLANERIQTALAEKEEELSAMRRELALYQRLIGPDAQRQGLAVHELVLRPARQGGSVAFSVVATQNRDVQSGSAGRLTLSIEGQRDGRLERLDWPTLAPPEAADGLAYDFRYFQRIEGRFLLPEDFQPLTVRVQLRGRNGETAERSLRWDEAMSG